MKTRGKAKGNDSAFEYGKAGEEFQDINEDGVNGNGYLEEKMDEVAPVRGENKANRNGGSKRSGRVARAGAGKGRSEKQGGESAEFKEVVQGFFEFIEELRKMGSKRPLPVDKRKFPTENRLARMTEEPKLNKKVRSDAETTQGKLNENFELQPDAHGASNVAAKLDKNSYYRYNEDLSTGKDLLPLIKEKETDKFASVPAQSQEPKTRETEAARRENASMMDFNSKYSHLPPQQFPGATLSSYNNPMLMKQQQQLPTKQQQQQQQQQQQASNLYGGAGFDFNIDILQRLQMQQSLDKNPLANYFMQSQSYGKGFMDPFMSNNDMVQRKLLELFQKPMGANSLFDNLPSNFGMMNPVELAGGQRYPNQSLGLEVMQSGPSAMNPRALEGKLGRAATHVAIAYFIYFKSLDPDAISKSDKSKMDPTYNARMLKEKKHDPFASESLGDYLLANMSKMNTNHPFDYLNQTAALQRLLAQQGNPDQLREAQFQRLQQELAMRGEEMNPIRGNYHGKQDTKVEEEAQKRRANEHKEENRARQQPTKAPPKAEEIIEINENSDNEEGKQSVDAAKQEQKSKPAMSVEVKPQVQQLAVQAGGKPQKGKGEEATGNMNAEDIVEEISVLTGQAPDAGKGKKKNAGSNNNAPASGNADNGNDKKPAGDEAVKVEGQAAEVQKIEDGNEEENQVVVENNGEKAEEKIEEKMEEEKAEPTKVIAADEGENNNQAAGQEKMSEEPKPEEKQ